MGQTALLPLRRKADWGFFRPEKSNGFGRVWTRELGYQRPAGYLYTTEAAPSFLPSHVDRPDKDFLCFPRFPSFTSVPRSSVRLPVKASSRLTVLPRHSHCLFDVTIVKSGTTQSNNTANDMQLLYNMRSVVDTKWERICFILFSRITHLSKKKAGLLRYLIPSAQITCFS